MTYHILTYYTFIRHNAPAHWAEALPYAKQLALARLHNREDQTRTLTGLHLLKTCIQALGFAQFTLHALHFAPGRKPYCELPIDFNITHSDRLVACACTCAQDKAMALGIDAEVLSEAKTDAFLNNWTAKEAVAKASGEGLKALASIKLAWPYAWLGRTRWHLKRLDLHADYVVHLAVSRPETIIHLRQVNLWQEPPQPSP